MPLSRVLRILKVYWGGRSTFDQTLGVGRDNPKLRSILFVIVELFSIQLIRVVFNILNLDAVVIIIDINQMFNLITRSVISIC